jgi:hypothetical protein
MPLRFGSSNSSEQQPRRLNYSRHQAHLPCSRHLNWSSWEGTSRGLGGLFHTPNWPVPPTKRPNAKRKSKTKAFFPFGAHLTPSERLPHHHLDQPNPPDLAHPAPTRRFWIRQGSALPLPHTLDIRLEPHIPPPYPATSPLFSGPCPLPCFTTEQRETGRHNAKDDHAHRHTHPARATREYR